MKWAPKLSHVQPEWLQFESAVRFDADAGEAPEAMRIIFAYKPAKGGRPPVSRFSMFYKDERIYAVDCGPHDQHVNKVGKGRAYFRQSIGGIHEHLWSEADRDGYAEPLPDDFQTDLAKPWQHFSARANLTVPGGLRYPPAQALWKQQGLDLPESE